MQARFLHLSAKSIGRLITAGLVATALISAVFAWISLTTVGALHQKWRSYEQVQSPRNAALIGLVRAIGYGGLVHKFKDAVILRDPWLVRDAKAQGTLALNQLRLLETHAETEQDLAAITKVEEVIDAYIGLLDYVRVLITQKLPAEAIDEAVKVDDTEAAAALRQLLSKDRDVGWSRSLLIASIRHALGYAGVVHKFKEVLLRADPEAKDELENALSRLHGLIGEYHQLDLNIAERTALRQLSAVLNDYELAAQRVLEARRSGIEIVKVEARSRINDGSALEALQVLDAHAAIEVRALQTDLSRNIGVLDASLEAAAAASVALVTMITALALFLIDRGVVRPARFVAREIDKLAAGDVRIDVEAACSPTEIGRIAKAAKKFRDTLVELDDSRRALEDAKEQAQRQAWRDSLTGLANRRFLDNAAADLEKDLGADDKIHALQIDLDGFKQINDSLGHAAGDAVLKHVAAHLVEGTRKNDLVARTGGDEFVVMCAAGSSRSDAASIADRILSSLEAPFEFEGEVCRIGASIGIATTPARDIGELFVNADIALYHSKRAGRGRVTEFCPTMRETMVEERRLADELANAIENREFFAVYQLQFDASTLEIVGAEALARWRHPRRGVLAPNAFLKTAISNDMVADIDRAIFLHAAQACSDVRAQGLSIPRIAVNVSGSRLNSDEILADIRQFDAADTRLSLELLETVILDFTDHKLRQRLDRIRELEVDIDIDDFGSDRASIVNLVSVQPNRLKIDKTLIMPIVQSPMHRSLVSAIVQIGDTLGIETVAEGVETSEHVAVARDLGCAVLQGYALSRPMEPQNLIAFMHEGAWPGRTTNAA